MFHSLQPLLTDGVQSVSPGSNLPDNAGYVLLYVRHTQLTPLRAPFNRFYPEATPLHVVTLHGVPYVWLYDVPRPIDHVVNARFGDTIELHGYAIDPTDPPALRQQGTLTLTLQWQARAPVRQDYLMFVHLLDETGQRIVQIDVPPAGPTQPTSTWEPGRYLRWSLPLDVPTDLEPGRYWLALGLYDPATFARLPVDVAPPADAPDAGGGALLLESGELSIEH
jgi:hypothetical protein